MRNKRVSVVNNETGQERSVIYETAAKLIATGEWRRRRTRSEAATGRQFSAETKEKMSQTNKRLAQEGLVAPPEPNIEAMIEGRRRFLQEHPEKVAEIVRRCKDEPMTKGCLWVFLLDEQRNTVVKPEVAERLVEEGRATMGRSSRSAKH